MNIERIKKTTLYKQLAPVDLAFKMKELGFAAGCFAMYDLNHHIWYIKNADAFINGAVSTEDSVAINSNGATAPLWQQVIDFLEDHYQIYVMVTKDFSDGKFLGWAGVVEDNDGLIELHTNASRHTAREAAIWKAIDIIEKRIKKGNDGNSN